MLFDLQGRRRRVVQATYLMLAVLMGGGLVFFGIGGDVQGGLFDAFSERGGNTANIVDDRIETNEERVKENPRNAQARKELVQDYYAKAASLVPPGASMIPPEGQDELRKADANYQAYLDLKPEPPDASLALVALNLYGSSALDDPKKLQEAARLRAEVENDAQSYLQLVDAATRAGDTRAADLAGGKVVELARKGQKKQAEQAVEQTKLAAQPPPPQPPGGAQGGAPGAPGAPPTPLPTPAPQP